MIKIKCMAGVYIGVMFLGAAIYAAYIRDWRMVAFYVLSAAINIVVVL